MILFPEPDSAPVTLFCVTSHENVVADRLLESVMLVFSLEQMDWFIEFEVTVGLGFTLTNAVVLFPGQLFKIELILYKTSPCIELLFVNVWVIELPEPLVAPFAFVWITDQL